MAQCNSAATSRRTAKIAAHIAPRACIGEMENRQVEEGGGAPATAGVFAHRFERRAVKLAFQDASSADERYGGAGDTVVLEGELLLPPTRRTVALIFMHPSAIMNLLPMPAALARAGEHVLTVASRFPNNDSCLVMEKVLLDLGAVVQHARGVLGYARVVLVGWSGGGSLAAFYQSQAEKPAVQRLAATPAGDAVDLSALAPADALVLMAAHSSRARIFTEWLDPAVLDEANPARRDPGLDLYGGALGGPSMPLPLGRDFVARFRAAQLARNHKITAWARARLAALEVEAAGGTGAAGDWRRGKRDEAFVVSCTQADPRRLDGSLEPNERPSPADDLPAALLALARENHSPVGLARFTTLRSWLSQWSAGESNADGPAALATVRCPALVVANGADHLVPPSHSRALYDAVPHADKEHVVIAGASHYYFGQRDKLEEATTVVLRWLRAHGFE